MNLWEKLALAIVTGFVIVVISSHLMKQRDDRPAVPARPQLVYVSGPRCPACEKMKGTLADPRVAEKLARFAVVKTGGKAAHERYGVTAIPTYLVLAPDGTELRRGSGYRSPDEFLAWLGE